MNRANTDVRPIPIVFFIRIQILLQRQFEKVQLTLNNFFYETICRLIKINLAMKIYSFSKILKEIGKGTQIKLSLFHTLLSSKQRLKAIRQSQISIDFVSSLLGSLANTNTFKLTLTVILFIAQLSITIASPFLTNYLIENYLQEEAGPLLVLLIIFLAYKIIKSAVSIICDFCYQSLGYEYFSRLYWHIFTNHRFISGKMLNIIEFDCNMISNLPYASLTTFFNLVQILVIIGLFTYYLSSTTFFFIFAVIIILYLCSQALVSYFTFQFTKKYLLQKDKRLNYNINNNLSADMMAQRDQELDYNRKFLYSNILSKFVTIIYPMLINLYIFVFTDRQSIKNTEYILLILINLIRNPINQFLFALNLMVQISNSCQRIVNFKTSSQDIINNSIVSNNNEDDRALIQDKIVIGSKLNQQKGLINLKTIKDYCVNRNIIAPVYWILLVVLILLMLGGKFYNYLITKHLISHKYTLIDFLGLGYQLVIPVIFYYVVIVTSQNISKSLFARLRQSSQSCEFLNRISGDITAIDRSFTMNLNQTISSLTFIFSSYAYSIYSLNNIAIQIALSFFLIICFGISYKANRFIMLSRRQVSRKQCLLKANIIKSLINGQNIRNSKSMKRAWRNIFQCKQMGLFIENYFMIILNVILLIFTLLLVGICKQLDISSIDKSILLIACLNVDFDLVKMFISAVRLEICLVSFERVINAISSL